MLKLRAGRKKQAGGGSQPAPCRNVENLGVEPQKRQVEHLKPGTPVVSCDSPIRWQWRQAVVGIETNPKWNDFGMALPGSREADQAQAT